MEPLVWIVVNLCIFGAGFVLGASWHETAKRNKQIDEIIKKDMEKEEE